ncbi:hypothetical protein CUMW_262830 [Citrus unshiu]|uniref:DUF1985 domain-containing protein n=1 Tax=Citrus unshiu TaxID=55188 RepID=A0A2H5QUH7_CITUN|nr:hypothetical protein CUMW_262830 [Citrus unshiu]
MVLVVVVFVVVVVVLGVLFWECRTAAQRRALERARARARAVAPNYSGYIAKSELSDIEVGRMYFRYADHFPGRISGMCNLSLVIKAIEEKLTKRQLNLFKNDIFGHFLKCRNFSFNGVILHNLLLRQVAHEEDSREDQLWFQIDEHLIRLLIVEWCLVTGLSYVVNTELRNNQTMHRLRNTYFDGVHCKINLKEFDALFKKLKFEEMDDMDTLKIVLFYFTDRTTRLKNPHDNIEKYNLYGFTSGVQAWIYEAIRGLPSTWVVKTKKKIPCIVQWKPMASSRINFAEVYSFFNDESRLGDVLQTLEPNSKESSRKYWLTVKDYMLSIPDWVHKFI